MRTARASGGGVSSDQSRAATHLVGLVDKARKMDQRATRPLLESHDTVVANALAAASRGIG